jgi:hypothetical protein
VIANKELGNASMHFSNATAYHVYEWVGNFSTSLVNKCEFEVVLAAKINVFNITTLIFLTFITFFQIFYLL